VRARNLDVAAAITAAVVISWAMLVATPASATGGACPRSVSGFASWDVATQPYQADNATDLNGDGWVCARPTSDTFTQDGQTYTVYLFIDDNVPG
jgi:hypothetical protein